MNGPLPPPSATGVRIAGDHYQWLIAWQACVTALREELTGNANPIIAVGVEVKGAGNLDDVTLLRQHPPQTYMQVKYAVDATAPVNSDYLLGASSNGGPSILAKIARAHKLLAVAGEPIQLKLVTNRAPDGADPLIAGRDARTGLLMPRAEQQGPNSARGAERQRWADAIQLSPDELLDLLAVLEFDTARDLQRLEEQVSLLMLVTGLRGNPPDVAAGAEWVAQHVRGGHRELDLRAIHDAVDRLNLAAGPARTIVSIATLKPDPLRENADYAIDWVDRFAGAAAYQKRRPQPPATWSELQGEIESISSSLGHVSRVVVTGSLRQATAFVTGAAFRMVTNVDVAVVQRGQIWSSDTSFIALVPQLEIIDLDLGDDIALAVEVSTGIAEDVVEFIRSCSLPVAKLVVMRPADGISDRAVPNSAAACALAFGMREAARQHVKGHSKAHLFLAGPMGLALLLGHRWNRVAPTVVYEDLHPAGYGAAFSVIA